MRIEVEQLSGETMAARRVEIVERKGIGHPDSMCDAMMERISVALCRSYKEQCGRILHHNIDKGLLAAGKVERWFGGGRVVHPMELFIGDRATMKVDGRQLPVAEIAVEAARQWLKEHLRFVDAEKHVDFHVLLSPGSEELTGLFDTAGEVHGANDTSAAVGYYPLTPTEQLVLDVEHYLNSPLFKERFPETGEDVKIMGLRRGGVLDLTVAMPLLCQFVKSEKDYFARMEAIEREIRRFAGESTGFTNVSVRCNALDRKGQGLGGIYLSLLGSSAEDADSGQVGRGNRVNGLIAVGRPLGTEAVAGKNPVSHVGKIYNVLAHRLAREVFVQVEGVREVYLYLVSRIGDPVDRPQMVSVQVLPEPGCGIEELYGQIEEVVSEGLAGVDALCRGLSIGAYPVC